MTSLPAVVPRLVVYAEDVADLLTAVGEERRELEQQLERLESDINELNRSPVAGGADDELGRAATGTAERFTHQYVASIAADMERKVEEADRQQAERVCAAMEQAEALLAQARTELADRLLAGAAPAAPAGVVPGDVGGFAGAPASDDFPAPEARVSDGSWGVAPRLADDDLEAERFMAFWSHQTDAEEEPGALGSLVAGLAPMAGALTVILLLLLFIV